MILTNENWYYLYLEDGVGGTIMVPPTATVELPEYVRRYSDKFVRHVGGGVPTDAISIGESIMVHTTNELDNNMGVVIDKDDYSYKIQFGDHHIWFPFSEVTSLSQTES